MRKLLIGTAAICALLVGTTARADVLYSQAADGSGLLYASQNDTTGGNGNFATVYDDFTLGTNALITDVHWTGGYFNPGPPGSISAWTVTFYGDNAGQPGASFASYSFPGDGGETFVSGDYYNYSENLPGPLAVNSFTRYWMSVVPNQGYPPQWGWATATGGNGVMFQDFFGGRTLYPTDLAYSLTGQAVPEPASMSLLALGLGALALRRRIRK